MKLLKKINILLVISLLMTNITMYGGDCVSGLLHMTVFAENESFDEQDLDAIEHISNFKDEDITPYTDEEFFGEYNTTNQKWTQSGYLNYEKFSGMDAVEAAVKNADYETAKEELLKYYRELYKSYSPAYTKVNPGSRQGLNAYAVKNNFQLNTTMIPAILGIPKLSNENNYVEIDITDRMSSILRQPEPVLTVQLFGLKKDGTSLEFESINALGTHPPTVEVTVKGVTTKFVATDDATISPMANYNVCYGSEPTLKAEESVSSIGLARLTDSNTKRSLVKFDFSDVDNQANPTKAVLKLYGRNASGKGSGELLAIEFSNNAWNEDEVTFYRGKSGSVMEHATFSNYGKDTFRFEGGVAPDRDGTNAVFAYRYPEELLRFSWAEVLAQLYLYNKDEEYALTFLDQWVGYLEQRGKSPRYDKTLDGHCRDKVVAQIMSTIIESEYVTPQIWSATMKYYLMEIRSQIDGGNDLGNWGSYQIKGLTALAIYAPTLTVYDEAISTLQSWVTGKIEEGFYEDGSGWEIEWGYSFDGTFTQLLEANQMFKAANLPDSIFPQNMQERGERIANYFASFLMPGGGNPQVGDGAGYQGRGYDNAVRNGLLYDSFDLPHWKWLATDGKEGIEPTWTAARYTGSLNPNEFYTGVYTLRTDWSDDALYLYTDVDGNMNPGHSHHDDNQLIVHAYGKYLLVDPSFTSYASNTVPLASTKYHNTVVIDDTNQVKTGKTEYEKSLKEPIKKERRFESNSLYDNLTLTTPQNADHYGLHTRNTLFVKSGFFIVNDYLEPNDTNKTHKYQQHWHMLPEANPTMGSDKAGRSNFSAEANVIVAQANTNGISASIEDGFFGAGTGRLYDSKYLRYEKNSKGKEIYNTVIYPEQPGETATVKASEYTLADVSGHGAVAMHIDITSDAGTYVNSDYYLVHDPLQQKERSFGKYKTDGRSIYIGHDTENNVNEMYIQDATSVVNTENGKVLFKSKNLISELGYKTEKHKLVMESSKDLYLEDFTLYIENADEITQVYFNETSIPFNCLGNYMYFGEKPILAEGDILAGAISGGKYLIGDFTDSNTAQAWAAASAAETDKYDSVLKGLSLGWVMSDSTGSYLSDNEVIADLDFSDYHNIDLSFNLGKNANTGVASLNNYLTIVLSTASTPGNYGDFKKNECLVYEIPLKDMPLNEEVNVSIPLDKFTTQFDGMSDGVQGDTDGVTNLSDIKSIGLFGGYSGFFGATGGVEKPENWTWLFKNSDQSEDMSCGFVLYNILLSSVPEAYAKSMIDRIMESYTEIYDSISLPTTLNGFDGYITWESDRNDIIGADGTVNTPDRNTDVVLTAQIVPSNGEAKTVTYNVTVKVKSEIQLKAGIQSDGSYLIGDFCDKATATAWADSTSAKSDIYDSVFGALSLGWVQTDSGGSYLNDNMTVFSDLDFSLYNTIKLGFNMLKNENLGINSLNNYLTVVLSTAEELGDYTTYRNDECLVYEIPLKALALNERSEVTISLNDFVTQFDGMSGGVQGDMDGVTDLSDIKSIALFGGYSGFFGAKGGVAKPSNWTMLFKNSGQNEDMSCGFLLYDISLLNETEDKTDTFDIYNGDGKVITDLDKNTEIYGKAKLSGYNSDDKIIAITALYKDGRLIKCRVKNTEFGDGIITTPVVSFDSKLHDKVAVFIWNDKYEPITDVNVITALSWVDGLKNGQFEGEKAKINYNLFSETKEKIIL